MDRRFYRGHASIARWRAVAASGALLVGAALSAAGPVEASTDVAGRDMASVRAAAEPAVSMAEPIEVSAGARVVSSRPAGAPAARAALVMASPSTKNGATYVSVPSNYHYNPRDAQKSLHDYCTASPDAYFGVSFKGPCARHDMCIAHNEGRAVRTFRGTCDSALRKDLRSNCDYTRGRWDWRRCNCRGVAEKYYQVVTARTTYLWATGH
ncbi:hypothetical protein JCM18899A_11220 [Nocardioides sp. AN3]